MGRVRFRRTRGQVEIAAGRTGRRRLFDGAFLSIIVVALDAFSVVRLPATAANAASTSVSHAASSISSGTYSLFPLASAYSTVGDVAAANGSIWFVDGSLSLARMNPSSGAYSDISGTPSGTYLTTGSDGNVWVTAYGSSVYRVDSATGVTTAFPSGCAAAVSSRPLSGPDGNVWYTCGTDTVGKMTTSGVPTTYHVPAAGSFSGLVSGPDGNLWIGEPGCAPIPPSPIDPGTPCPSGSTANGQIVRMSTTGSYVSFALSAGHQPRDLAFAADGALWFTPGFAQGEEYDTTELGRLTTGGVDTYTTLGQGIWQGGFSGPGIGTYLRSDSVGRLWFESQNNSIARLNTVTGVIDSFGPLGSSRYDSPDYIDLSVGGALTFDSAGNILFSAQQNYQDGSHSLYGQRYVGTLSATAVPTASWNIAQQDLVVTDQYTLTDSDGSTWVPMYCAPGTPTTCASGGQDYGDPNGTATYLTDTVSPSTEEDLVIGANADLWTWNAGLNQDIGLFVNGSIVAWKESGGFAGTFSPNAAYVQAVVPVTAGHTYTVEVRWKTNKAASGGKISAGAGPLSPGAYSPTRLTTILVPASAISSAVSTEQYSLANSDGTTWQPMGNLAVTVSPTSSVKVFISVGSDLWTAYPGYNQDIGIFINGTLQAWKESGGYAGTFSPNAAFALTMVPLTAGNYTIDVRWKTNKAGSGTRIYAGAGPLSNSQTASFSPSSLTAVVLPAADSSAAVVGTRQYTLGGSDGATWQPLDCSSPTQCSSTAAGGAQTTTFTLAQTCTALIGANADLWTWDTGDNQDLGVYINGELAGWKESGGFAGTFSPNAAFLLVPVTLTAGVSYTVSLGWKSNTGSPTHKISAGAGPLLGAYSTTSLALQMTSCWSP